MLENIVNQVVLPPHEDFFEETQRLRDEVQVFLSNPGADTLDALQERWLATNSIWRPCTFARLSFDFMVIHNRIDRFPIRDYFIEEMIAGSNELTPEFISGLSSNAIGVNAIEYLIFDPAGDELVLAQFEDPRRQDYLVSTVENLHLSSQTLLTAWEPEGGNFAELLITAADSGGDLKIPTDLLVNRLIAVLENFTMISLGRPMGLTEGSPQPELVENARSGQALQNIVVELTVFRSVFTGLEGLGYDDYLASLGQQPLADQIVRKIDEAHQALMAIEGPLDSAVIQHPEQVQAAHRAIADLVVLFKVDLANQLGTTLTFNDFDGD